MPKRRRTSEVEKWIKEGREQKKKLMVPRQRNLVHALWKN